jgi:hypothetical protein
VSRHYDSSLNGYRTVDLIATATVSLLHRPEHANNFYSVVRDIMSDINHANFINDREETNGEKGDQGDEAGQDGEVTHTHISVI